MRARIEAAEHIALIAHVYPDADTMGSACSMYAHLLRLHKKVTLFCASEKIDERLACIPWSGQATPRWNAAADLAIAFDCGSPERLGVTPSCTLINIDHHPNDGSYGDIRMLDTGAVSTTAILMHWFEEEQIRINAKMATALYAGIAEDTLAFMSKRTDSRVFEMAARLCAAGADTNGVNHALFKHRPLSALRLKSLIFGQLELLSDARIVLMKVTQEMMERTGAEAQACDSALQEALGLPTIRVALMLRERKDGSIKVTLRTDDGIDVGAVAAAFGGGGHHFAAGFVAEGSSLETVAARVLSIIEKELE
jgi:bifunctional oligoribonuclease and PAP phosphatase NrnA